MISSRTNALIKQVRALRRSKARRESGLFLVEGIHHVGEVLEAGWQIDAILYAPQKLSSEFARDLVARFRGRVEEVSPAIMESISDKDHPQGIIAVVHQKHPSLASLPKIRYGAALVAPQDPGNMGTVLRTLDAVGGDALFLLDGGADPYHPTSIRASLGTAFWIPVVEAGFAEFDSWRRKEGCQLLGTSARAKSDVSRLKPAVPWILLLGSEQKGLTDEQTQACDVMVSLPMRGRASSLNLAVAAGVLLYTLTT